MSSHVRSAGQRSPRLAGMVPARSIMERQEAGDIDMSDRYADYRRLKIDRPEERILRIVMDSPGRLNAADAAM